MCIRKTGKSFENHGRDRSHFHTGTDPINYSGISEKCPFYPENEEGIENETVNWDYKEEMILDRYEETLTIRQVIAPGQELTKKNIICGMRFGADG